MLQADQWELGMLWVTRGKYTCCKPQVVLLSGHHAGLYNYIHTKVGKLSLLL